RCNEVGQLRTADGGVAEHGFRPEFVDKAGEEMFEDHGMTGNVPARVEAHAALGVSEHLHALGIKRIEAGIGEDFPMGAMKIVEPLELRVAVEIARRIGKALETVEQVAKRCLEMGQ